MTRKLDVLVAAHVMELNGPPSDSWEEVSDDTWGLAKKRWPPSYSTTWAAMGEVVEKMEGEGFKHGHTSDMGKSDDREWWFWHKDRVVYGRPFKACSGSLPAACAFAALRAKGVPEETIQDALKDKEKDPA